MYSTVPKLVLCNNCLVMSLLLDSHLSQSPPTFNNYTINLQEQQLFFDNCLTWVSLRLIAFAVTPLRRSSL